MRQQSGLFRLAVACVGLLTLATAVSAQTQESELYFNDPVTGQNALFDGQSLPQPRLPVLFVHGHNLEDRDDADFNYQKNWQQRLRGISFRETLEATNDLGIEPYYLRLIHQGVSIAADAVEIERAVGRILHRHDTNYNPQDNHSTTHVQVVIIAYSKGTISTRVYLKNLHAARPDFHPVSEFIALAPPNHGLSSALGSNCAARQLMNGYDEACNAFQSGIQCLRPEIHDFMTILNGRDVQPIEPRKEAPGSRADIDSTTNPPKPNPPTSGTLYVTIFANGGRDFVGGDTTADSCGRGLAKNLSPDAVTITLPDTVITNDGWLTIHNPAYPLITDETVGLTEEKRQKAAVHQNTVHTFDVICKSLYAAVHHRSPEGVSCGSVSVGGVVLPVIPPPSRAAAMLTLDFSGSMSSRDCAGCNTRAEILQDAVELFIRLWSAVSVPSDRIGLIHFDSNVTRFPTSGEPLPFLKDAGTDVITYVGGLSPGSSTAMGNALQQSIQTLSNPALEAEIRRVILFTDGMQNVNPMARIVNDRLTFVNETGLPNSIVAPGAPTVLDPSLGIAVDTIGIGAGETFVGPLGEIAAKTKGRSWATNNAAVDLRHFFIEELINALKGFSPQLVAYRHGVVAAKGSTEAFGIEDGVRKLVLKLSWKRGDSMDFSVARDGVDVTPAGRFIKGPFYKIFVIDLPTKGGITARGNWELRIDGQAGTAYETAAIIDGGQITYDAMFDTLRPRAGEPLDLMVRLKAAGKPIPGSAKVTVTLLSPTTSVGDIIATIKPKELKAFEPGTTRAEAQLLALTQDPSMWAALKPKSQTIVLKATEKGDFRMQFKPQIPGLYTALVTIEGDDEKLGHFSRTQTVTAVVRFAPAKLKQADASVTQTNAGAGWRYVTLNLSPRDKRGHLMGPGFASAISFQLSAGRRVGDVHDLGDGSYMLVLARPPGDDPIIKLEVGGSELFSGRLSKLSGQ